MVLVTVVSALLGLGLGVVGWWGLQRNERLGVVAGWDERSIQRRSGMLRRGAYACLAAGTLFVALAVVSVIYRPDNSSCPPPLARCATGCPAAAHCGAVADPAVPR